MMSNLNSTPLNCILLSQAGFLLLAGSLLVPPTLGCDTSQTVTWAVDLDLDSGQSYGHRPRCADRGPFRGVYRLWVLRKSVV